MLAVYEMIDLGIVSMLSKVDGSLLELLHENYPVFSRDPIHDEALYLYHSFGVHALNLGALLQSLAVALRAENENREGLLLQEIQKSQGIGVQPILSTFSVERRWAASFGQELQLTFQSQMFKSSCCGCNSERCVLDLQHLHANLCDENNFFASHPPVRIFVHSEGFASR